MRGMVITTYLRKVFIDFLIYEPKSNHQNIYITRVGPPYGRNIS